MLATFWPMPFSSSLTERAQRVLDLACLTGNRLRLARLAATADRAFLPPAGCAATPRETRKPRSAVLHFIAVPASPPRCAIATWTPGDARRSFPASSTTLEAAMGAARNIGKE